MRSSPLSLVALLVALASPARADVAPAFASKVTLDAAWVTGADQATDIAFSGDGRALITRRTGQLRLRRANGTSVNIAYPFGGTLDSAPEKGLLGVVADPNVAINNTFYFYVSNGPTNDKHRVYKATLTAADSLIVDPVPIITASLNVGPGLEGPANHNGGGLVIHGGKLYVSVGDTGGNASPPTNKFGSCLNKGNGKILRVNLDGTIPSDNPLVGLGSVTGCDTRTGPWITASPDPRVFAWGFRNPWRFWVDPNTSLLWIGDVGEVTQEEISIGSGNQHYGWPFFEGEQPWGDLQGMNCSSMTPSRICTPPAHAYGRSEGSSVTGGLIPAGCGWTNVFGSTYYLFGDSVEGWIRALPVNGARTAVTGSPITFASFTDTAPVSIRMGPDGSLYAVMYFSGAVYRFTPTALVGADCPGTAVPSASFPWLLLLAGALALSGIWVQTQKTTRWRLEQPAPSDSQ